VRPIGSPSGLVRNAIDQSSAARPFIPHVNRNFGFTVSVDMGNLMTLGVRWEAALHLALVNRMEEAADHIIAEARMKLQPGHGYDTGRMYDSLVATLVSQSEHLLVEYELHAGEDAYYWWWVEFGHMTTAGNWWPGYYFLSSTVLEERSYIFRKVQEAVHDSIVALAAWAHVDIPGLPGI
jgi:hypothetical protein